VTRVATAGLHPPDVAALRRAGASLAALSPRRRRARRRLDRGTALLGALALASAAAGLAGEAARLWYRGSAPTPAEADHVIAAAEEAAREIGEVVRAGYRETPARENALFNLLASFVLTWGGVRTSTWVIRHRGTFGPFRNLRVGRRHIHHFVPGIVLAFLAGGAALVTRDEDIEPWLAIPFGAGVALTLDESALLLELEDVYWTERGLLSVQITLAAIAMLGAGATARRLLRRGEARVLSPPPPPEPGSR
jgi:peptidoglycan/LPS O-acetylase OafA/YrhL